jgi:chromosome partitioning protein
MVKAARNRKRRPICVLLPSKVDLRTTVGGELPSDLKEFGEPVGPAIRQLTAHVEAFEAGTWIGDYALGSPAHADIASLARSVAQRST